MGNGEAHVLTHTGVSEQSSAGSKEMERHMYPQDTQQHANMYTNTAANTGVALPDPESIKHFYDRLEMDWVRDYD